MTVCRARRRPGLSLYVCAVCDLCCVCYLICAVVGDAAVWRVSCRKFLTIVLSVVRFGHPMSLLKWSGVTFVFGGLIMEAAHKYQVQRSKHQAKPKKE